MNGSTAERSGGDASARASSAEKAELVMRELGRARAHWAQFRLRTEGYTPRAGDVHVVTYAKSGTTLLQQMAYQLAVASGGASARDPTGDGFRNLADVTPWYEYMSLTGVSSFDSTPRVFKSHLAAYEYDLDDPARAGLRFIYCFRDGARVPGSMLDMMVPWMLPDLALTPADRSVIYNRYVADSFFTTQAGHKMAGAVWFGHVRGWTREKRENVLVLQFEAVVKDLLGTARRIARFLDLEVSEEGFQQVVGRCGREKMANDSRFREVQICRGFGWAPGGGVKARVDGESGFRAQAMTSEHKAKYDELLASTFEGARNYADVVAKIEEWQRSYD